MSDKIVSAETRLAAKRGFVRTTLQGYEGVLYAGVSANVVLGVIRGEADLVTLAVTAAVAVLAPPIAGLRSYISIYRKGIPTEYVDAGLAKAAADDGF